MSIELRGTEKTAIDALWTVWKSSEKFELESTVKSVSLTQFLDTVARLRAVGLREQPQQPKLNILMPGGLRFTIVGTGSIQEYCEKGDITKVPFSVIKKDRRGTKTDDQIDLVDYGVRLKLRREENLDKRDARVIEMIGKWQRTPKRFRYIRRYTFIGPDDSGLRFDLSLVRESAKDSKGDYVGAESFKMADILRKPIKYEIEAEADRTPGTKAFESSKGIINGLSLILQGLQRSFVLIRKKISDEIVDLVAVATESRPRTFPGPQPATLERANIGLENEPSTPNIRHGNYNVTDKADGLRTLLVVSGNGRLYLVDSSFRVYATGLQLEGALAVQYKGTVLDGEWIRNDKLGNTVSLYYAFDIYTTEGRSVSSLPFMNDSDIHRYSLMKKTIDILATAKQTIKDIPSNHSLIVSMKTFYSTGGAPGYIFNDAAACLDSAAKSPYYTDGLIFTPNNEPMPMTGRTWDAQLKWKPAHDNTIDFLVVIENEVKEGVSEDKIGFKYNEDENQMLRHKTLRLFVGGKSDVAFRDPRDTILNNKPIPDSIDTEEYQPVEFRPLEPADVSASICHIALDGGVADPAGASDASQDLEAKMESMFCTRTKDPITSNSIVEMAYHPEKQIGWRWEPIRVRWDKTERLQTGNFARTMNADWVADNIWTSIHNPVTEIMIRTGTLSEDTVEERPVYYTSKKVAKRDTFIVRKMNSFHNKYIKSELLLQKTLRRGDSILDLACGRGGDLIKWITNRAGWVMGVDFNLDNLIAPKESIYGRYLDAKIKNKGDLPPMVFLQADSTRNIKDGTGLLTDYDKKLGLALYDNGPKEEAPSAVETLRGFASSGFDVVSCMFAIHYMFKDRSSVDGFLRNLSDNLKINGFFVGCCFDGDAVFKLLSGLPDGGVKTGRDKDTDIWSIRRSYAEGIEDVLPASDAGLGKAIDVFYYSIGEEHREYLVSFEYLTKRLAEIGCELLNPDEMAGMSLSNSTNLFSESHKMTGNMYNMSRTLKEFSFLNRWFIFRRRTVGKLVEMDKPVHIAQETTKEKAIPESELIELAAALPATIPIETTEKRPIYKFFHGAVLKDDLKIGRKDWARYLSIATLSNLHDINDPSIIYPSLEAAFASALFQVATDKPDLGPTLFSVNSTIHQDYMRKLKEVPDANDKRKSELLEDEILAIRNQIKPAEIKRLGVKYNEADWLGKRETIMQHYITERYNTDSEFKRIMDAIKAKNGILVFYNGPKPSELGGLVKDNNVIVGQNKLGIMYMHTVGLTQ